MHDIYTKPRPLKGLAETSYDDIVLDLMSNPGTGKFSSPSQFDKCKYIYLIL